MADIPLLLQAGAQPTKQTKFAPLTTKRFFRGLWTQRNPFLAPGTRYDERFLGGSDALIDGLNVEISNSNTLQRRPGFLLYAGLPSGTPLSFFTFHRLDTSTKVIADTTTGVYDLANLLIGTNIGQQTEALDQSSWINGSFGGGAAPTVTANVTSDPFGNPNKADQVVLAAAPVGGQTGIGQQLFAPNHQGVNYTFSIWIWGATSGTVQMQFQDTFNSGAGTGGGAVNFTTTPTRYSFTYNFPSSLQTGTKISIYLRNTNQSAGVTFFAWGLQLEQNSVATTYVSNPGAPNTTPIFTKSTGAQTYFESVGNTLFMGDGVDLKKWDGTTVSNWGITAPTTAPTLSFIAGPLSPTAGYSYCYTFKNGTTQHPSTASPISASTGKQVSQSFELQGSRSTDPQVNTIQIYRNTDGGAFYFLLAEIANPASGNWTYTDTSPDSALNQAIQAPLASSNNPPAAGLINPVFHSGRLWGSVGNTVYYSGGPQTTNGSGMEAWPPLNFFTFPSLVKRMVPYANGLFVFTTDQLWAIWGTDPTSYYSKLYSDGLGLLSYNALAVESSDVFMFTSDRQVDQLGPSVANGGLSEIGFAIADKLEAINPASVYITSHISGHRDKALYISDGVSTIYRCNPNQAPEGGATWSAPATVVGGVGAIASVETTPGTHKLMIGQSNGAVLVRDLNTFSDSGATYSAFATIGSLVLAQPGQLAEVESITTELRAVGTQPAIGVLLDEISGTFETLTSAVNDPPQLSASASVYANRYYLSQGAVPKVCRHMQLKLSFVAEAAVNELLSFSVLGAIHPE